VHHVARGQTYQQRDESQPHVARVARGLTVVDSLEGPGVPAAEDEN